jgi:hypothetical protein
MVLNIKYIMESVRCEPLYKQFKQLKQLRPNPILAMAISWSYFCWRVVWRSYIRLSDSFIRSFHNLTIFWLKLSFLTQLVIFGLSYGYFPPKKSFFTQIVSFNPTGHFWIRMAIFDPTGHFSPKWSFLTKKFLNFWFEIEDHFWPLKRLWWNGHFWPRWFLSFTNYLYVRFTIEWFFCKSYKFHISEFYAKCSKYIPVQSGLFWFWFRIFRVSEFWTN